MFVVEYVESHMLHKILASKAGASPGSAPFSKTNTIYIKFRNSNVCPI